MHSLFSLGSQIPFARFAASIGMAIWVLFWLYFVVSTFRIIGISARHCFRNNRPVLFSGLAAYAITGLIPELWLLTNSLLAMVAGVAGLLGGIVWAVDLWSSLKAIVKSPRRVYVFAVAGVLLDLMAECVRRLS